MKAITLTSNLLFALLSSLTALIGLWVLPLLVDGALVIAIMCAVITVINLAYLLYFSQIKSGKITLALVLISGLSVILMVKPAFDILLVSLIVIIWLARSLLFYGTVLSSIIDLGLCLISLTAAYTGFILSGSIVAGVWCFMLIQALFVFIPLKVSTLEQTDVNPASDPFNKAHQSAESALRTLANKP